MNNAPQVKIQYLVNYDLEISGQDGVSGLDTSGLNPLSSFSNINNQDAKLSGKKGFILSGGSVDNITGEVSGVLLDGTYTFFSDSEKSYNGIIGNSLSRNDGLFINSSDYESKTGEELEQILQKTFGYDVIEKVDVNENTYGEYLELQGVGNSFLTKYLPSDYNPEKEYYTPIEYKYYCSESSEHFKSGNVYLIKWVGYDYETPYYGMGYEVIESPQYITIKAKNENTYIRSLLIYFDTVASEYATEISFSNAKKYDPNIEENDGVIDDNTITRATIYKNNRMVFIHNFGEDSTLTQVQVNINKWSKKNSLMKILKIVTGYTGIYDKTNLMEFDFTINKTNDAEQLRFGVSSNNCVVDVLDNDLMIDTLYKKDLIYKNIQVQILVDNVTQGIFYINEKNSEKGSNEWVFDCVDKLELLKEKKIPMLPLAERNIYQITNYILSGLSLVVDWEFEAKNYCESLIISNSYFNPNQKLYDLLLKCCQVGLLRIYIDKNDNVKIVSGVN